MKDYHNAARFHGEAKIRHGKHQGRGFVLDFLDALPAGARERFTLRSLQVEGNVAYITSNVRSEIPPGTDTFVIANGKIVARTFAMLAAPAQAVSMVPGACKAELCGLRAQRGITITVADAETQAAGAGRSSTRQQRHPAHPRGGPFVPLNPTNPGRHAPDPTHGPTQGVLINCFGEQR